MITRKAWIPGVGIYSVRGSHDFSDPTDGMATLGPPPASRPEAQAEREERKARLEKMRNAGYLKFDVPAKKPEEDVRAAEYTKSTEESDISSQTRKDYKLPPLVSELGALIQTVAESPFD